LFTSIFLNVEISSYNPLIICKFPLIIIDNEIPKNSEIKKNNNVQKDNGIRRTHACTYCKYAAQNELIDDALTKTEHNDFA
jgi:hypothetical protein